MSRRKKDELGWPWVKRLTIRDNNDLEKLVKDIQDKNKANSSPFVGKRDVAKLKPFITIANGVEDPFKRLEEIADAAINETRIGRVKDNESCFEVLTRRAYVCEDYDRYAQEVATLINTTIEKNGYEDAIHNNIVVAGLLRLHLKRAIIDIESMTNGELPLQDIVAEKLAEFNSDVDPADEKEGKGDVERILKYLRSHMASHAESDYDEITKNRTEIYAMLQKAKEIHWNTLSEDDIFNAIKDHKEELERKIEKDKHMSNAFRKTYRKYDPRLLGDFTGFEAVEEFMKAFREREVPQQDS